MNHAITTNLPHGERGVAVSGTPTPEGPNERAKASERVDPVMGLHWRFEIISKVVTDRVEEGDAAVNAPLPAGTALKFPGRSLRPFELFAEYLDKPGSVVARRGDRDHDLIVHPTDPTRLTDQNAGLYYEAVARTLHGAFGPPRPRPVAGPQSLREVLRDICAYLIAGASKDVRYASSWRNALDKAGVDQYGFLTGPVANRVVLGTVGDGAACGDEHWSLDTAHALLSVIVDALGEGSVQDFADDLRARCALADDGPAPGEFEAVDGKLLVAILGLARFRNVNPRDPASFGEVFGTDSEPLAHRLRAWCWLWAGSEGDAGRPVARRLADIVLRQVGWIREWHGKAQGDALLSALRKEPNAFPRRLAVSSPLPAVTTVAPSWPAAASAAPPAPPPAEEGEAAGTAAAAAAPPPPPPAKEGEAAGDGAPEGFRLLQLDEVYRFDSIDVDIVGMSGVGKTTFLRSVLHHMMQRRSELFPGADELVLADRCSEAIRDGIRSWREGKSTPSTPDTVLDYALELPRLMTIRLVDHRGALLDLRRDPGQVPGEGDERLLTETMKEADGIVALISVPSLVQEARGDRVAADQRVPEVDAIADRLGRVMSGRQSDHVPLALVFNKLDDILTDDEGFRSMYEQGAVFGDGVSGGHLPRVDTEELTEWAVRQPIATRSLAAQSIVSRSLKVLAPICAQIAAHTRRVELFFTSSKPVEPVDKQNRTVSSAGPAAVVSWLLKDNLVPAFIAQAKDRISSDRKTVASAGKDHDVVRRLARLVAVDPRAGAALSMLPGINKIVLKMRARRIGLLDEILRRYGIDLSKDPSNDELFSARDRLEARIAHSTAEIDAMKGRLNEFEARFRAP